MWPASAKYRRSLKKSIGVIETRPISFTIAVVENDPLRRKAKLVKGILPVKIKHKRVVRAQPLADIVQAAIGIFFQTPKPGRVVLPFIVVAYAE